MSNKRCAQSAKTKDKGTMESTTVGGECCALSKVSFRTENIDLCALLDFLEFPNISINNFKLFDVNLK